MKLIEQCVHHPIKVYVGLILVVLFGLIAIGSMPVQLVPEIEIPKLTITTTWPGASPQEIETEIIKEQEEALSGTEGVTKMTAECSDSTGVITLEFPTGADIDAAITLVNTRLQQVRNSPENADKPVISIGDPNGQAIAWFVLSQKPPTPEEIEAFQAKHPELAEPLAKALKAENLGLKMYRLRALEKQHPALSELLPPLEKLANLRKFAEDVIEAKFEKIPGISSSNVFGGNDPELQVLVDPEKLAARKITLVQLRDALRGKNYDVSGGDLSEGKRRWVVRTLGRFRDVEQVRNTLIMRVADQAVYVSDVATVQLGYKKPSGVVRRYGTEVIAVNVQRRTGVNVITVMNDVRGVLADLNAGAIGNRRLELVQVYDETEYIKSSINMVWDNIVVGSILTLIVLLLFLRNFRSTIVVFISIIVSIIGMFLMMRLMGRTLNVPSLAGIAFAVGMLVDNFIVVLENAFRFRQLGYSAWDSAIKGAGEVWGAVLTSSLANLAVFIPVLFVQDQAGQLFRDIALAAAASLIMSLFIALFFVPAAAARMLHSVPSGTDPSAASKANRWTAWLGPILNFFDNLGTKFVNLVVATDRWLLGGTMRMVAASLAMVVGTLVLSYLLFPKVEYLPQGNRNLVFGIMFPPPGVNLKNVEEMGSIIENKLKPYWDVDPDTVLPADDKTPLIGDFFYVARGRQLFLGLSAKDPDLAAGLVPKINSLGKDLPGTFLFGNQMSLFERGLVSGRSIDLEITGPDLDRLAMLGGRCFGQLTQMFKGMPPQSTPMNFSMGSPELQITAKPEQAEDNGIGGNDDLGYMVDALVDGAYTTDYYLDGDKIDLSVIGNNPYDRMKTEELRTLMLATPQGDLVELQAVANITLSSSLEQLLRREKERAIKLIVTPPDDVPLQQAIEDIQTQLIDPLRAEKLIGDGQYDIKLAGTADKLKVAWDAMKWNLLLALVITYLVMAALFESWLYPLVIILSVPLGAVGGLMGLYLLNWWGYFHGFTQSLDVLTMLGFIILVGTVVNNPILIVEQALNLIDGGEGHTPREAIIESVHTRIRPIFMTTFIAFFGLLPLVLSPGAGSELYRGIGAVLLGGLLVSTLFTLFLVPCLFTLALESRAGLVRMLGWSKQTAGTNAPEMSDNIEPTELTLVTLKDRQAEPEWPIVAELTELGEHEPAHGSNGHNAGQSLNAPHAASSDNAHSNGHDRHNGSVNGSNGSKASNGSNGNAYPHDKSDPTAENSPARGN